MTTISRIATACTCSLGLLLASAPAALADDLITVSPGDVVTDDSGRECTVLSIGASVPGPDDEEEWHSRNYASAQLWTLGSCGADTPEPMLRIMAASIYEDATEQIGEATGSSAPDNPFHDIETQGPYVTAMGTRAYKDGKPVGYIGNTGAGVSYMTLDYREARWDGPAKVGE